jgi:hypothetical protein
MRTHLVALFLICSAFKWADAQQMVDTFFFDLPELKVNNHSFLHDLDTMLQKSYLSCEGEDSINNTVYIITIEQKREYVYLLTIEKLLLKYAKRYAKGFFKINNIYFFVGGIFPENPKELFTMTDNNQQFYNIELVDLPNELTIISGRECTILLEYRYATLFFLKSYWKG